MTNGAVPRSSSRTAATAAASCGRRRAGASATREGWERPLYWTADGGERRFDRVEPLEPRAARDARLWLRGRRLRALARRPAADRGRVGARGRAVRARARRSSTSSTSAPVPAGPFVGDCWEWTASEFERLPGLRGRTPTASTRRSSSARGYRVLRGGSWATRPRVARDDLPQLGPPAAAPDLRRLPLRGGSNDATTVVDRPPRRCSTRSSTTCATG